MVVMLRYLLRHIPFHWDRLSMYFIIPILSTVMFSHPPSLQIVTRWGPPHEGGSRDVFTLLTPNDILW